MSATVPQQATPMSSGRSLVRRRSAPHRRASAIARRLGLVVVAIWLPGVTLAADDPACPPPQRAVFACSTGTKTIAVCASPDLSVSAGSLQYRFANPAAVELSYPPPGVDWRSVTRGGTLTFSGGGGAWLAFAKPPFRYTVYNAIGRGWGRKAGVVVEKDGRRIARLACRGEAKSELGADWLSSAGIATSDEGFELP